MNNKVVRNRTHLGDQYFISTLKANAGESASLSSSWVNCMNVESARERSSPEAARVDS